MLSNGRARRETRKLSREPINLKGSSIRDISRISTKVLQGDYQMNYHLETASKWRKLRINKKFFKLIRANHPERITNLEAYELYGKNCARIENLERHARMNAKRVELGYLKEIPPSWKSDTMLKMNVRNQLSALAYHGYLVRTAPGCYCHVFNNLALPTLDEINAWVKKNILEG